jgi:hypothetical protein
MIIYNAINLLSVLSLYPCGLCQKAVKTIDQAVMCDKCDTWFHINCESISEDIYKCLIGSDCSCRGLAQGSGIV